MNKNILMTALVCCLGLIGYPLQGQEIATSLSKNAKKHLNETRELRNNFQLQKSNTPVVWIPVQIHILATTQGYQAMDSYTLGYQMNRINQNLLDANIQLYLCGDNNVIVDDNLYNLYLNQDVQLDNHDVSGKLNLYFVNAISQGVAGPYYCGYSKYPGDGERIVFSRGCYGYDQTSVLMHLIGQYFSLYPTHGSDNSVMTAELVDGSNCATTGDEICDTPADPRLNRSGTMSACNYVGTFTDANTQLYTPDTGNFMSYASGTCRDHFSPMQNARMYYSATTDRAYLNCATPAPCATPINQYPYTESFENDWGGWSFNELSHFDMERLNTPTPTAGTGPAAAADGSYYVVGEATNHLGGVTVIESPCFDFSLVGQPQVGFQYHMNGIDAGQLIMQVSTDGGFLWGSPTSSAFIFDISGDQGNAWQTAAVDLSFFAGSPRVRVRIGVVVATSGDLGDIAIDAITVEDLCFGASVVTTPETCAGGDGSATLIMSGMASGVNVNWSTGASGVNNLQQLAAGNYEVTVTDNQNCTLVESFTIAATAPLTAGINSTTTSTTAAGDGQIDLTVSGGTSPYTFQWSTNATTEDLTNLSPGNYEVTVTDAAACTQVLSAYISDPLACNGTYNNWPYFFGFESNGFGIFKQNRDDDRNWRRRNTPTPTNNTGPNTAAEGNYYRYIETSGGSGHPYKTNVFSTKKCLDITSLNQPVFAFMYHMYGNHIGKLEIQLSVDGGSSWTESVWQMAGNQGNNWYAASIDLSPYSSSQLRIRVVATSGNGHRGDIGIDALEIKEATTSSNFVRDENQIPIVQSTTIRSIPEVQLFPNPARSSFTLALPAELRQETLQVQLINAYGAPVKQFQITGQGGGQETLSLQGTLPGIYYVLIRSGDKVIETKKLVVLQ